MIWINSVVKCLNQDSRGSRIPSEESFRRRSLCETLMNTLRKLKYKIITDWPTSFRWVIWSKACPSLLFSLYSFHGEANFGISQSFASSVSNRSEHSLLVYDHKLFLGSIQQLIFRVSDRVSQSKMLNSSGLLWKSASQLTVKSTPEIVQSVSKEHRSPKSNSTAREKGLKP